MREAQKAHDLTENDIKKMQPSIQDVQKKIDASSWKSFWMRNAIDALSVAAIASGVYWKWFRGDKKTA